jgi:hypothetical protein
LTDKNIYPTVIIVNTLDKEHLQMISSTFSEATTRRAALGAIIAAGAIGVAPIAAGAAIAAEPVNGVAGLDAGLLALIDEARAAGARVEAAIAALEEAQERTEEVPWPQTLIVTEDDTRLWKLQAGDHFDPAHLNLMRERQAHRQRSKELMSSVSSATWAMLASGIALDDKDRAAIEKMNATDAREDQLIAALDDYGEAQQVASDLSGETAANDRFDQLWDEKADACNRVANFRARTLSGVLAKLAFIAPEFDDQSASELPAEMGTSPEILFSVAVDFKTLKAGEVRT